MRSFEWMIQHYVHPQIVTAWQDQLTELITTIHNQGKLMNDLTTQNNLPANGNTSWGSENVSSDDILIPNLMLMHDISQLVKDEKAKPGSIVNSTTNETMATKEQKLELIPITMFKQFIINELELDRSGKEKEKFLRVEPITAKNEHAPREDFENGLKIRRVRCMNFFCLVPDRLQELPFLVRFKKSGYQAGKKLATHFQTAKMKGVPPASQIWQLSSKRTTSNDNSYFVLEVEPGRETTPVELDKAYYWYQTLNKASVKLDTEETSEAVPF